jgi:hypothetical protein
MKRNHKLVIGAALAVPVIFVGGAIGATKLTPKQENQAIINDAAEQLGVQPSELSNALKQALKNRVDAAVEDGRLTQEQGQSMKERIDAGEAPFLGRGFGDRGHHGHHFFHAKLEGAAGYLGMTEAQLKTALEGGKTLAQVARDRNKSVDGLVNAMVQNAEQKLQDAVEAGKLTEAQKSEMLEGLKERITGIVNGEFPRHRGHRDQPGAEVQPGADADFRPATF